ASKPPGPPTSRRTSARASDTLLTHGAERAAYPPRMRIKRCWLVVAAAIVVIDLAPVLVGAAEIAWGMAPGNRADDIVYMNGEPSRCEDYPWGCRVVEENVSCRIEAWLEDVVGWRTPFVRRHEQRLLRTHRDIRAIMVACDLYSTDHAGYPPAHSLEELRSLVVPRYMEAITTHDGWGRPYLFESGGPGYLIASSG